MSESLKSYVWAMVLSGVVGLIAGNWLGVSSIEPARAACAAGISDLYDPLNELHGQISEASGYLGLRPDVSSASSVVHRALLQVERVQVIRYSAEEDCR